MDKELGVTIPNGLKKYNIEDQKFVMKNPKRQKRKTLGETYDGPVDAKCNYGRERISCEEYLSDANSSRCTMSLRSEINAIPNYPIQSTQDFLYHR